MSRLKYSYHITMAAILDTLATIGSYLMRNAGAASNRHEKEAERCQ